MNGIQRHFLDILSFPSLLKQMYYAFQQIQFVLLKGIENKNSMEGEQKFIRIFFYLPKYDGFTRQLQNLMLKIGPVLNQGNSKIFHGKASSKKISPLINPAQNCRGSA